MSRVANSTRLQIVYQGGPNNTPLDTGLTGGTIGGLLEFRSQMLDPTRQSLGETALALVAQFNAQHASGMDLRDSLGSDFFAIAPPTILHSSFNAGSGTATATVSDLAALTGVDYVLEYDGASYTLTRADTGTAVPMSGTGTVADPFLADGIEIEVAGAPAVGDRVMIRTGHAAAGSIQNVITDPRALAIAAPTRAQASNANIGGASIGPTSVVDSTDPGLLTTAVITFTSPTTDSINGSR